MIEKIYQFGHTAESSQTGDWRYSEYFLVFSVLLLGSFRPAQLAA